MEEKYSNQFDYNYKYAILCLKSSPTVSPTQGGYKGGSFGFNQSVDGVKSVVSEHLQQKIAMPAINRNNNSMMELNMLRSSDSVGSIKRYSSTQKLLSHKFQNASKANPSKKGSLVLYQPLMISKGSLETKQMNNNASFSHRESIEDNLNVESRYQKLYQK